MCQTIVINRGEKEIESVRDFIDHFDFIPELDLGWEGMDLDSCLCQIDVEKSLADKNIPFKKSIGDIYVGMLDEIIGDEDRY